MRGVSEPVFLIVGFICPKQDRKKRLVNADSTLVSVKNKRISSTRTGMNTDWAIIFVVNFVAVSLVYEANTSADLE